MTRLDFRILLLESHRHPKTKAEVVRWNDWIIGGIRDWWESNEWEMTVRELKEQFEWYERPNEERLLYANHLTSTEVSASRPLGDDVKLSSLPVSDLTMIVISKGVLSDRLLQARLPHMNLIHRQELLTQLHSLKMNQLDLDSIRETVVNSTTDAATNQLISIRDYKTNTCISQIMNDGEEYIPVHVNSKVVKFHCKYSYQYSTTSDEYAQEVTQSNETYESELSHCKKLLHDLPMALEKSEQKLSEDTRSLREHSGEIELSDLGALSIEQAAIREEIQIQRNRRDELEKKPFKVDKSKFIPNKFQFEIHLPFGWHKFGTNFYELLPIPTLKELQTLTQLNRHTISVKRKCDGHEINERDGE